MTKRKRVHTLVQVWAVVSLSRKVLTCLPGRGVLENSPESEISQYAA